MRRPFIVYGSKHFLTNMHKLGFKTFSRWWDEGYDTDPESSRYHGIVNNINWILQQNHHTIQQWWTEMKSILDYNVAVLQNLTNQQITTTEFVYEQR
jgi:DNA modification methylase